MMYASIVDTSEGKNMGATKVFNASPSCQSVFCTAACKCSGLQGSCNSSLLLIRNAHCLLVNAEENMGAATVLNAVKSHGKSKGRRTAGACRTVASSGGRGLLFWGKRMAAASFAPARIIMIADTVLLDMLIWNAISCIGKI
eukprot:1152367-Pelagomonas_calceolata.AAC.2